MNQLGYLCRRLLLAVPTFIGITLVCFALTRFLPGGPVEICTILGKEESLRRIDAGIAMLEEGAQA